jgi:hypothetical protein
MTSSVAGVRDRTVLFLTTPALWPAWPFLPVVRRTRGSEELGVVFDARGVCNLTGYSATVMFCNLFDLPPDLHQFLNLPKETFDGAEELVAAGWCVD